ncbi:hypothetical protein F01_400069 [Burkholderia cenocepacia]|nr:hypothetical protein F01_400069 [Burkholderia cenocepacia]
MRMRFSIGHHRVKPLCIRLAPAKAVSQSHQLLSYSGLAGVPMASETRIRMPVMIRVICQEVMIGSSRMDTEMASLARGIARATGRHRLTESPRC